MGWSKWRAIIRDKMWEQDPHCEDCGVLTQLPLDLSNELRKNPPLWTATLEHRRSRYHPDRYKFHEREFQLLCRSCNQDRAAREFQQLPKVVKEMLHRGTSAQRAIYAAMEHMGDDPEIVKWLQLVRE